MTTSWRGLVLVFRREICSGTPPGLQASTHSATGIDIPTLARGHPSSGTPATDLPVQLLHETSRLLHLIIAEIGKVLLAQHLGRAEAEHVVGIAVFVFALAFEILRLDQFGSRSGALSALFIGDFVALVTFRRVEALIAVHAWLDIAVLPGRILICILRLRTPERFEDTIEDRQLVLVGHEAGAPSFSERTAIADVDMLDRLYEIHDLTRGNVNSSPAEAPTERHGARNHLATSRHSPSC
jgi:hypothetical protein